MAHGRAEDPALSPATHLDEVEFPIWREMLVQIAAFVAVKLLIPSITRDIPEGKGAQGFFLGSISLGVGLLNAACMSF